ncbi:hypothetical protein GCM10022286_17790 [Gryllotalpicola daejeonensis]|uniref:MarR family transcriptional regulator n=2 Tax=Gryllotalpicola daejeonensis TaxID=993087 RepID=A0ABP7ZJZ5_9MICO
MPDPVDRRAKRIVLTAQGVDHRRRVRLAESDLEAAWRAELGSKEWAALQVLLERLASIAGTFPESRTALRSRS